MTKIGEGDGAGTRKEKSLKLSLETSKTNTDDIEIDVVVNKRPNSRLPVPAKRVPSPIKQTRTLKPPKFGGCEIPEIVVTRESPLRRQRPRASETIEREPQRYGFDDDDVDIKPIKPLRKAKTNHLMLQVEWEMEQRRREKERAKQRRDRQTLMANRVRPRPVARTEPKLLVEREEEPEELAIDDIPNLNERAIYEKHERVQPLIQPRRRNVSESPKKTEVQSKKRSERMSPATKKELVASLFETPKSNRSETFSFDDSDGSLDEFVSQERQIREEEGERDYSHSRRRVESVESQREQAVRDFLTESKKLVEKVKICEHLITMPGISQIGRRRSPPRVESPARQRPAPARSEPAPVRQEPVAVRARPTAIKREPEPVPVRTKRRRNVKYERYEDPYLEDYDVNEHDSDDMSVSYLSSARMSEASVRDEEETKKTKPAKNSYAARYGARKEKANVEPDEVFVPPKSFKIVRKKPLELPKKPVKRVRTEKDIEAMAKKYVDKVQWSGDAGRRVSPQRIKEEEPVVCKQKRDQHRVEKFDFVDDDYDDDWESYAKAAKASKQKNARQDKPQPTKAVKPVRAATKPTRSVEPAKSAKPKQAQPMKRLVERKKPAPKKAESQDRNVLLDFLNPSQQSEDIGEEAAPFTWDQQLDISDPETENVPVVLGSPKNEKEAAPELTMSPACTFSKKKRTPTRSGNVTPKVESQKRRRVIRSDFSDDEPVVQQPAEDQASGTSPSEERQSGKLSESVLLGHPKRMDWNEDQEQAPNGESERGIKPFLEQDYLRYSHDTIDELSMDMKASGSREKKDNEDSKQVLSFNAQDLAQVNESLGVFSMSEEEEAHERASTQSPSKGHDGSKAFDSLMVASDDSEGTKETSKLSGTQDSGRQLGTLDVSGSDAENLPSEGKEGHQQKWLSEPTTEEEVAEERPQEESVNTGEGSPGTSQEQLEEPAKEAEGISDYSVPQSIEPYSNEPRSPESERSTDQQMYEATAVSQASEAFREDKTTTSPVSEGFTDEYKSGPGLYREARDTNGEYTTTSVYGDDQDLVAVGTQVSESQLETLGSPEGESATDREWRRGESATERESQRGESATERESQRGESATDREWQQGESATERESQQGESAAVDRDSQEYDFARNERNSRSGESSPMEREANEQEQDYSNVPKAQSETESISNAHKEEEMTAYYETEMFDEEEEGDRVAVACQVSESQLETLGDEETDQGWKEERQSSEPWKHNEEEEVRDIQEAGDSAKDASSGDVKDVNAENEENRHDEGSDHDDNKREASEGRDIEAEEEQQDVRENTEGGARPLGEEEEDGALASDKGQISDDHSHREEEEAPEEVPSVADNDGQGDDGKESLEEEEAPEEFSPGADNDEKGDDEKKSPEEEEAPEEVSMVAGNEEHEDDRKESPEEEEPREENHSSDIEKAHEEDAQSDDSFLRVERMTAEESENEAQPDEAVTIPPKQSPTDVSAQEEMSSFTKLERELAKQENEAQQSDNPQPSRPSEEQPVNDDEEFRWSGNYDSDDAHAKEGSELKPDELVSSDHEEEDALKTGSFDESVIEQARTAEHSELSTTGIGSPSGHSHQNSATDPVCVFSTSSGIRAEKETNTGSDVLVDAAELELDGVTIEQSTAQSLRMFMPALKGKPKEEEKALPVNLTRVSMILRRSDALSRKDILDANLAMSKVKNCHLVALLAGDLRTVTGCYYLDETDHVLRKIWGHSPDVIDPSQVTKHLSFDARAGDLQVLDTLDLTTTDGICM